MGLFPYEEKLFYIGEDFEGEDKEGQKLTLLKGIWYSFMNHWRGKLETIFFRNGKECEAFKIIKQEKIKDVITVEIEGIEGTFQFSSSMAKYRELQIDQIFE